jgi:hypothetical protein
MSICGVPVRLAGKEPQMELLRKFGPYLAIEALMPGGTLLALLLYLGRNRKIFLVPMSISRQAKRLVR